MFEEIKLKDAKEAVIHAKAEDAARFARQLNLMTVGGVESLLMTPISKWGGFDEGVLKPRAVVGSPSFRRGTKAYDSLVSHSGLEFMADLFDPGVTLYNPGIRVGVFVYGKKLAHTGSVSASNLQSRLILDDDTVPGIHKIYGAATLEAARIVYDTERGYDDTVTSTRVRPDVWDVLTGVK